MSIDTNTALPPLPARADEHYGRLVAAAAAREQSPPPSAPAAVNAWNLRHPIGSAVIYRKDNGECIATVTLTPAAVIGGHTAVIWLKRVPGCVPLDRVTPVEGAA